MSDIGVIYICRYPDPNFHQRLTRFVRSWVEHPPGVDCQVYVIYKEFPSEISLELLAAQTQFSPLNPVSITKYNGFNSFGGGCFLEACDHVEEPLVCTLVSTSEIMHSDWLKKLYDAYNETDVGMVGCTGSRDSGNIHIRDTAILIDREFYMNVSKQFDFKESKEGYLNFEHGPNNLTIQVLNTGKRILVVEKDRVLRPDEWGFTTYRGNLENVLVHDRGARDYNDL